MHSAVWGELSSCEENETFEVVHFSRGRSAVTKRKWDRGL